MPDRNDHVEAFYIEWRLDSNKPNAIDAALEAYEIMRGPGSTATVFNLYDEQGDETQIDIQDIASSEYDGTTPDQAKKAAELLQRAHLEPLVEAARAVIANWEKGDLAAAVSQLAAALETV